MAFNWRAAEKWRNHPLLTGNERVALPGLGIGLVAFALYVAYDKMSSGPKKHGH